jgi:hypothetical protein
MTPTGKGPVSILHLSSTKRPLKSGGTKTVKNRYFPHLEIIQQQQRLVENKHSPEKLVASHLNDFNLHRIHETVMRKLYQKHHKIDKWNVEIQSLKEKIKRPQRMIERRKSVERIRYLEKKIQEIREESHIQEYINQTESLLKEYDKYFPKKREIDFLRSKKKENVLPLEEEKNPLYWRKIRIVKRYVEIASRYVDIQMIVKKKNVHRCVCGYDLNEVHIDNLGIQICPECNTERYIVGHNLYKTDTFSSKNEYNDEDNFEKALMRYQGKQPDKIPDTLFEDLDAYFSARGFPTSEEIRALEPNAKGRKPGTSLPILYKALQETDNSTFYEDANLIAHKYWGWTLPDVTSLESVIKQDYRKTQRIYNSLQKERSSSLGTQYRLFKHLEMRGHPCSISDFKIVKMRESLEYHDKNWKIMCERCQDPEIFFIPTI